jgi:hypothetical protein
MLAEYLFHKTPGPSYFSFPARVFEFIPGVAVAFFERNHPTHKKNHLNNTIPLLCFGLILSSAILFTQYTPFPSLYTLIPVFATAGLIFFNQHGNFLSKVLSTPLLTHIGKLSYCLYLWHWPIFVVLLKNGASNNALFYIGIPATYLLALGTSFAIENPIRKMEMAPKNAILYFTILPFAISLSLVITGKYTSNFEFLYNNTTQLISKVGKETAWEDARTEKCWVQTDFKIQKDCMLGDTKSDKFGILWGDSHAYHLIDFIDLLGKSTHVKFMDHAFSMCPPVEKMDRFSPDHAIAQNDRQCNQHNINTIQAILNDKSINIVAISATWITYDGGNNTTPNVHGFYAGEFRKKFLNTLNALTLSGKKIILFNDIPYLKENQIDCALKNSLLLSPKQICNYSSSAISTDQSNISNFLNDIAQKNKNVFLVDTLHSPCSTDKCEINYKGLPLYKNNDYGHLNRYGSRSLFEMLLEKDPHFISRLTSFLS